MSNNPSVKSFKELKDLISTKEFSDVINSFSNSDIAFVEKNELPITSNKTSIRGLEKITKEHLKELGLSLKSTICIVEPNEEPTKTNVEWYKSAKDDKLSEKFSKLNNENSPAEVIAVKKNKLK